MKVKNYKFENLEEVIEAEGKDCLRYWIHDYLNGPGQNPKLATKLSKAHTFSILTDAPLNTLVSIAGPDSSFKYPIEKNKWEDRVRYYENMIKKGNNPLPLIVTQGIFGEEITVADGNHRLEALKRAGIERYPVIFYQKA